MNSDLRSDIFQLVDFVGKTDEIPEYENIVVVEDDGNVLDQHSDARIPLKRGNLYLMKEYQALYEEKKKLGVSWINLQCAGLYENNLVIVVEYSKSVVGLNNTSVNFSGPFRNVETGRAEWDFVKKFRLC